MQVPFCKTTTVGAENHFEPGFNYQQKKYFNLSKAYLEKHFNGSRVFLTKSCSEALALSGIAANLQPGDEVIMPSFGFVADANAVALRGAQCVFVDIEKDTLNIDVHALEKAITPKTKAVIVINYGGVACNYEQINRLKEKHKFTLIEDNAHGMGASYKDKPLGTFGDMAAISFDSLKNISCGEGGCLLLNNDNFYRQLSIAAEFGTNRTEFFEKKANKYEWKGLGTNSALSEYLAYFLYQQIQQTKLITNTFLKHWNQYYYALKKLEEEKLIDLPHIPESCKHNAHIFHIRTKAVSDRDKLIAFLKDKGITASFHYTPLHLSEFGKKYEFRGNDSNTVHESGRLLRLPMYHSLTNEEIDYVVKGVYEFFGR